MDNQNKEMTRDEMEQDFKNMVFEAFSKKIPGVYRDEEGFIVVPTVIRRRKASDDSDRQE